MFALAASMLRGHLVPCAIKAVYSPGQAIVASAVGADWIIPYVNRAKRLI
jgi:transaldolase